MQKAISEYYEKQLATEFKMICGFIKGWNIREELKNIFPALLLQDIIYNCDSTNAYSSMTIFENNYSNDESRKCYYEYKKYIENILVNNLDFEINYPLNENLPINYFWISTNIDELGEFWIEVWKALYINDEIDLYIHLLHRIRRLFKYTITPLFRIWLHCYFFANYKHHFEGELETKSLSSQINSVYRYELLIKKVKFFIEMPNTSIS